MLRRHHDIVLWCRIPIHAWGHWRRSIDHLWCWARVVLAGRRWSVRMHSPMLDILVARRAVVAGRHGALGRHHRLGNLVPRKLVWREAPTQMPWSRSHWRRTRVARDKLVVLRAR